MKIPEIHNNLKSLELKLEQLRQEFNTADTTRRALLEDLQDQCPHPEELLEAVTSDDNITFTCIFCKKEGVIV